ncbi:MAG: family 16 glycoside hydrolase [Planctomycetota bacterium]
MAHPMLAVALALATGSTQDVDRIPGLTLRLFQLEWTVETLPELVPDQTPNVDRLVATLEMASGDFDPMRAPFMTRAVGWLAVETAGTYRLRLTSDDGSRLFLDGERALDNDGQHGPVAVTSEPLQLDAGEHPILVEHFDSGGGRVLKLEWQPPGADGFSVVPSSALRTEDDPTRVTSPGFKAIVSDKSPGNGLPLRGVHPAWRVETIRPEGFEPRVGSMTFLPDGRLAFGTFDPLQRDERNLPDIESKEPDVLWALDVRTGKVTEIATDLFEPSGLCVVRGELYVAHRRAVERLVDRDGDGYFETHEVVGEGWQGWNYHQFTFGLVHRDGKLYTALSTTMAPPAWEGMETNSGPNDPLRGCVLEIDTQSGEVVAFAGGVRTPNGLGLDAEGRLLYSDNQGAWMPTSILAAVEEGDFFGHYNWTRFVPKLAERFPDGGHPSVFCDRPRKAPTVWLPHGEVVNSPTEPLLIQGGEFEGQILLGELTGGGIRRVHLYESNGVLQGTLLRFTQGLESGVNRMEWGPDGALYVGGIGANGNWNWRGTRFGLQRLVPTGELVYEIHSVEATRDGFRVRLTDPADLEALGDPSRYTATSWTYAPTQAYGGPKVDEREHAVTAARGSADGRTVELSVEGLRPGTCVHLTMDLPSYERGEPLWSGEAWATLSTPTVPSIVQKMVRPPVDALWALRAKTQYGPEDNVDQGDLIRAAEPIVLRVGDEPLRFDLRPRGTLTLEWRPVASEDVWLSAASTDPAFRPVRSGDAVESLTVILGLGALTPVASSRPVRLEARGAPGAALQILSASLEVERPLAPTSPSSSTFPPPVLPSFERGPWRSILSDTEWVVRGGDGAFEVTDDGTLVGTSRPGTPNTYFTSTETFDDFELTFDVRVDERLNSGVQIRSEVDGGFEERRGQPLGFQVEIDPSDRAWSGGLYETGGRTWVQPLHRRPYARRAWRQGAWNHYRILCEDDRIRTWINGVPAADLHDATRLDGHIGFQVHGVADVAEPLKVEWRKVRLRPLSR